MSVPAADPVRQCEAVTTNSGERPTVSALRKLKFWENPGPVMMDLSPVDNVNIEMHACANGLNTRRHVCCRLGASHPKTLVHLCFVSYVLAWEALLRIK